MLTFKFEEDFVENNIRCIPMIVRYKLDVCGIKLKLSQWSRFNADERRALSTKPCTQETEIAAYRVYLASLISKRTGEEPTNLPPLHAVWNVVDEIPYTIEEKLKMHEWTISLSQWRALNFLQRFALLKLSYPGHENKNFPKAMKEFGLLPG